MKGSYFKELYTFTMASATGVPQQPPVESEVLINGNERAETEPLLGRPGDAAQREDEPFLKNSILGMLYSRAYITCS